MLALKELIETSEVDSNDLHLEEIGNLTGFPGIK